MPFDFSVNLYMLTFKFINKYKENTNLCYQQKILFLHIFT